MKVILSVISIYGNLFFSHGTSRENLTGNLFQLSFAGLFSFIIVATTPDLRSQSKRIIYNVYKFFKELVALKPDGKIGVIFAKIQHATAEACEYSHRRIVRISTEGDVKKEKNIKYSN